MTEIPLTINTCYLAGPMRGYPEYNFPEFHKQAAWLRGKGWKVFSPAERDEADPVLNGQWGITQERGLDYYMQYDLAAVAQTDAVVLMNGWELSQGARLEAMVAVEIGHPVFAIVRDYTFGRKLKSVANSLIASEFIAGTRAYNDLPVLVTT
jgi:nucleoside 2-deoxyribosyltransferase